MRWHLWSSGLVARPRDAIGFFSCVLEPATGHWNYSFPLTQTELSWITGAFQPTLLSSVGLLRRPCRELSEVRL
ncbi:hypothetical protein F5Y18DRAFT_164476 [Xylariaceae sp. FL1019]|nr:hypothetical protein F5Y18DRAFT_164476 [Xylariaceae sp. FL1019]